jgi:peptidoglycan/LPS O-acetylase OafA/YrhL
MSSQGMLSALAAGAGMARERDTSTDRQLYIDGLRAIAILCVIGFHARISWMEGGFVGVDVFFVISGFLITTQIATRACAGTFSALDFYARRTLRIVPLLLVVTLATLLLSRFFPLLPREIEELGYAAAATAAMISNYFFMSADTFDYFAVRSETQPLLHTWSLGVEEQYYLFAPWAITLTVAWALRRRVPPLKLLLIAGAASCVASFALILIIGATLQTSMAARFEFYSLPTRAWQFGVGGTLALAILNGWRIPGQVQTPAGIAGLAAIAAAALLFDERTVYPGMAALLPTAGAALVLIAGYRNGSTLPARLLSSPPAVMIGVLSYGWYLWHWPLLAFTRTLDPEQDVWRSIAVSIVALGFAAVTYVSLERPMKRLRQGAFSRRYGIQVIAAGTAASIGTAVLALALTWRADEASARQRQELLRFSENLCPRDADVPRFPGLPACRVGSSSAPAALMFGDSHAMRLRDIAELESRRTGHTALVVAQPACPPLLNVEHHDRRLSTLCNERLDAVRRWLQTDQARSVGGVVLAARWALYSGERTASRSERRLPTLHALDPRVGDDYRAVLTSGLTDMLTLLGDRRILILGPIPELRQAARECLARAAIANAPREQCAIGRAAADERYRDVLQTLKTVTAKFPNVRLVDPIAVFCDKELCRPYDDGGALYADTNHLTQHGAETLHRAFESDFRWVFDAPPPKS